MRPGDGRGALLICLLHSCIESAPAQEAVRSRADGGGFIPVGSVQEVEGHVRQGERTAPRNKGGRAQGSCARFVSLEEHVLHVPHVWGRPRRTPSLHHGRGGERASGEATAVCREATGISGQCGGTRNRRRQRRPRPVSGGRDRAPTAARVHCTGHSLSGTGGAHHGAHGHFGAHSSHGACLTGASRSGWGEGRGPVRTGAPGRGLKLPPSEGHTGPGPQWLPRCLSRRARI